MSVYKDKGEPMRLSDAFAYRRAFRFWIATAKGHKAAYAAMRQRAERAEASAAEEEKACEKAIQERDELDGILGNIAACFDQEFSSSYGPEDIEHDIRELQENRDIWQSKVEGMEKRAREAIARAERVEDINKRLFNACRERNTRISDLTQRAEWAEAQLAELDTLLLGSLAALGIPTPVEGYRAAGWAFLRGDLKRAREAKERAEEALLRCQRLADDGVDDPAGPYNVLAQIANTVAAILSSPPADTSTRDSDHISQPGKMVGERRLVRLVEILSTRGKPIGCARCGWIGLEKELKAGVALGWFCPSCGSHEITEDIATIASAALADMEQKS